MHHAAAVKTSRRGRKQLMLAAVPLASHETDCHTNNDLVRMRLTVSPLNWPLKGMRGLSLANIASDQAILEL